MKLLLVLAAALGGFANATCGDSGLLTNAYTQVTTKIFHRGILKIADLQDIVSAEEPINPLRFRTATSSDSTANQFYRAYLARGIPGEAWYSIRQEVRAVLREATGVEQVIEEAHKETALLFIPKPVKTLKPTPEMWQTSSNRIVYATHFDDGKYEVRDYETGNLIWQSDNLGKILLTGLSENASGDLLVNIIRPVSQAPDLLSRMRNLTRDWYEHEAINVRTGESTKHSIAMKLNRDLGIGYVGSRDGTDVLKFNGSQYMYLADAGHEISVTGGAVRAQPSANGELFMISRQNQDTGAAVSFYRFRDKKIVPAHPEPFMIQPNPASCTGKELRDGSFTVAAWAQPSEVAQKLSYFPPTKTGGSQAIQLNPSGDMVTRAKIYETEDGRVLVAAQSVATPPQNKPWEFYLDVFLPSWGQSPIESIRLPGSMMSAPEFFEHHGRLYFALLTTQTEALVYEVGGGNTPIARMKLPKAAQEIEVLRSGNNLYLFTDTATDRYGYKLLNSELDF